MERILENEKYVDGKLEEMFLEDGVGRGGLGFDARSKTFFFSGVNMVCRQKFVGFLIF